jgi:hypothetical protein
MKLNVKNYWNATPKFYRALGDTLLSISTLATTYSVLNDDKYIALLCLFAGVIGKFLTNFATTEEDGVQ